MIDRQQRAAKPGALRLIRQDQASQRRETRRCVVCTVRIRAPRRTNVVSRLAAPTVRLGGGKDFAWISPRLWRYEWIQQLGRKVLDRGRPLSLVTVENPLRQNVA